MPLSSLLIANRGEIAIRIARAAANLGLRPVVVFSEDDALSLHVRKADAAEALPGSGPAAYLSIEAILAAAGCAGCDAIHPGYGFLSENAAFSRRVREAGLTFVGPTPDHLALFGDKSAARALAERCGVPVAAGTHAPTSLAEARAFVRAHGASMVKAVAGGGGRGMRVVQDEAAIGPAFDRCASEATGAFGNGDLYLERLIRPARHIEVQVIGDGNGRVAHLWERECTLQRRHQKLIEVAPSPSLSPMLRERIVAAALRMAEAVRYASLGTFEFLVSGEEFFFIEANPRLQVEHTVTEAVTGIDVVEAQLLLAGGASLEALGLTRDPPRPRGYAVQARINLETVTASGETRPASGTITVFEPPSGPGVRVDGFGYAGYATNTRFDPLLAKLIVASPSARFADAVARTARALREFRIEGVATNAGFLLALLDHPAVIRNEIDTGFVEAHAASLAARDTTPLFFTGSTATPAQAVSAVATPPGSVAQPAPMAGTVVTLMVQAGDLVREGQAIAVLEAMKMEMTVTARVSGAVVRLAAEAGSVVAEGESLLFIVPASVDTATADDSAEADPHQIRDDLAQVLSRRAGLLDDSRPEAVARRRRTGQRTARENVADLCDPGSFDEIGGLLLPMQRTRRPVPELIAIGPADGLIAGTAQVNSALFGEAAARCAVLSYDYTVFAGTQGFMAHRKTDRMAELAERMRLPVVLFSEGGGGRPGDVDYNGASGLELKTFMLFGRLSGLVPLVGINAGRCFAGNAALLGCCDVVIATRNSNLGMGGPAMIEGGGLGRFTPEEVGPVTVQAPNGVIDVLVADEAEAVRVARQYLSYFQGRVPYWEATDPIGLRHLVPENRRRVYDTKRALELIADRDSILELRPTFGVGLATALIRIEGRPLGVIISNPSHLGGAIDSPAADKAARFMQLCDAFDLPILTLVDTPGFMVGPESEKTATVRHFARLFVTGANVTVPMFSVILRKAYGLGAQALLGGCLHAPTLTLAWPTAEFGPMGFEGAVNLAYRKELAAIEDPAERQGFFEAKVAEMYEQGKALNVASYAEVDDVIDPADTRARIAAALRAAPPPEPRTGKKRPMVDSW